ncbi:ATP-binding protein [Fodinibius salsisoli]|uniref:histidine kinase n=1 Tax=Fodinibius salsisoli TaxID=2820877 RepID=A0ABT3PHM4_9BACT|nr:ATP-binding protein [Fodinibius salsisoli]MCW9705423.1 response regulator [Fodinibius salsisoli]
MMKWIRYIVFSFFLGLTLSSFTEVYAQSLPDIEGLQPFIRTFQPSDYQARPQNWDVVQDPDGLIYAANTGGVLQYDGYRWEKISMPKHNVVRQVEFYRDTLFVGGRGTWGYIKKDSTGQATYIPLVKKTEEAGIRVDKIRMMASTPKGLYFNTGARLLRWYQGKIYPFPDSLKIKRMFKVPNKGLLAFLQNGKIMAINGQEINPVYTGTALKKRGVRNAYDIGGSRLALFTLNGTYILQNNRVTPWITEAQSLIKETKITHTKRLPGGNFALATRKGLIVISPSGHLIANINKANGLPTDFIINIFVDQAENVWLSMNNGLAVMNLNSPVSHFAKDTFAGRVNDIAFYNHHLYIATTQNAYKLISSKHQAIFKRLHQTNNQCWSLLPTRQELFLNCTRNIQLIKNNSNHSREILIRRPAYGLTTPSQYDSTTIYAHSNNGLFPIHLVDGQWEAGKFLYRGRFGSTYVIGKNELITRSARKGVLRIKMAKDTVITQPFAEQKVSPSSRIRIYKMGRLFAFPTDTSLVWFKVKKKGIQIVPDPVPNLALKRVQPLDSTTAWGWDGKTFFKLTKDNTGWHGEPLNTGIYHPYNLDGIFPTKEHGLWISGDGKLVHIRTKKPAGKVEPPQTPVVRSITGINGKPVPFNKSKGAVVGNQFKGFRINYSSLPYLSSDRVQYQTRLTGFSDQWSPWTQEPFVNYSNLSPGDHTLHVRARNQANLISPTATLQLYIEPHWYQTWWARLIFSVILLMILAGVIYLITNRYRLQNYRLRRRVAERTRELSLSRDKISRQANRLEELNQLRTQFYTNISHELRTPLTLIAGPIKHILTDNIRDPQKIRTTLKSTLQNSQRLHRLVTQLLDLEKTDSDNLNIHVSKNDLTDFIRKVMSSFESFADSREITLTANLPDHPCYIYYDAEQLEKVLTNLLSNAIKFTSEGGKVSVTLMKNDDTVAIEVKDNGIGINEEDLDHIFSRFYQVDSSMTREEGIGIGLSLSYQLVELHHGKLSVQSEHGEGSTFTIRLLKGSAHFSSERIEDHPEDVSSENESATTPELAGLKQQDNGKSKPTSGDRDKKTLLIIDDNEDMCRYIRDVMEADYCVVEAHNGRAGLRIARKKLPDMILCDVMMPKMDGFTFTDRLKKDPMTAAIPIIFLTGRADKAGRLEGLETGADDYLTKPFDADILQVRIRNMIEQRMRLRKLLQDDPPEPESENGRIQTPFEKRVRTVIMENMTDEQFGVQELAEALQLSNSYLTHKLKKETDMSASVYIRNLRLEQAAKMLKNSQGNVSEIAYSVGFNSLSYFSRSFKEQFGSSPSKLIPAKDS